MQEKIALLMPTRQRLQLVERMVESYRSTTNGHSVLIFGIDEDDHTYDQFMEHNPEFIYEIGPRSTSLQWLNRLARKYSTEYKWLGFWEDDCTFRAKGWEEAYIEELSKHRGPAIVYNDIQQANSALIGLPFVTSSFVETLGYFCPTSLEFLWADNFWYDLGVATQITHRLPNRWVEHHHYSYGQSPFDAVAETIKSKQSSDGERYAEYKKKHFRQDVRLIVERLVEVGER